MVVRIDSEADESGSKILGIVMSCVWRGVLREWNDDKNMQTVNGEVLYVLQHYNKILPAWWQCFTARAGFRVGVSPSPTQAISRVRDKHMSRLTEALTVHRQAGGFCNRKFGACGCGSKELLQR